MKGSGYKCFHASQCISLPLLTRGLICESKFLLVFLTDLSVGRHRGTRMWPLPLTENKYMRQWACPLVSYTNDPTHFKPAHSICNCFHVRPWDTQTSLRAPQLPLLPRHPAQLKPGGQKPSWGSATAFSLEAPNLLETPSCLNLQFSGDKKFVVSTQMGKMHHKMLYFGS